MCTRQVSTPSCGDPGEGVGAVADQASEQPLSLNLSVSSESTAGENEITHGQHPSQVGSLRVPAMSRPNALPTGRGASHAAPHAKEKSGQLLPSSH
jgi:hypothetical protein